MQRSTVCGSPFHDGRHVFDGDPPNGMQRRADQDGRRSADLLPQCLDTLRPPVTGAVAEPLLGAGQRCAVRPGTQIAGVEQGEADTGVGGAVDHGVSHGIRVGVVGAAGIVVYVVELADRR